MAAFFGLIGIAYLVVSLLFGDLGLRTLIGTLTAWAILVSLAYLQQRLLNSQRRRHGIVDPHSGATSPELNWLSKGARLLKHFMEDLPQPPLESGEEIIRRGVAAQSKGYFGGRWGPLVLTNRRLFWHGRKRTLLPFKRNMIIIRLEEIHSIDKGNFFNFLFGGMCIRIRKENGRLEILYEGNNQLDEWIAAIAEAMSQYKKAAGH